ncbi:Lipoprotein-anchoring transpeptidase ErfK/SrfK [Devosia limi DSM 17137]|uniref:Lipoprotein-anchoring transpeptidase ErfK/SrfK n=2 Tax=Devosia limi DSM 17137 TaxID=1121477 RepID=A0A1M4ZSK1_9HYPH|nr:Lipoprotein-anchoring transpeptidase ErfK/SrfK [Devosia limi DSM 17137]
MISRRLFMIGLPLALAACTTSGRGRVPAEPRLDPRYVAMYGPVLGEPHPVAAVDLRRVDPRWWRQEVEYSTTERPGTIIVDTQARHLYLVQQDGIALRYGVGVGKDEALQFKGTATIGRKAAWPTWTPTANMIRREPERYGPYASGLPGGPANPLGPRALYLYKGGRDTYFRLHGTVEPYTIGTNVSSGCIRLMNQDIIDLYSRVNSGTKVVVIS